MCTNFLQEDMVQLLRQQMFTRPTQLRNLGAPFLRYARHIFTSLPREELLLKGKSRLRDRPYLHGSSDGGFPEFLAGPTESFPHAVQVQSDQQCSLSESAAHCREYIDGNLANQGAILFRNLPMSTAKAFSAFVKELGYDALDYEGGSGYRNNVDRDASTYTASNEPKEESIGMHNEMSYSSIFPQKVGNVCCRCLSTVGIYSNPIRNLVFIYRL